MNNIDVSRIEAVVRALVVQKLERIGDAMAETAIAICPHSQEKHKHLRDTITHEVDPSTLSVLVGSTDYRSHFIELGTRHQAPEPFLRPTLDQAANIVKKA